MEWFFQSLKKQNSSKQIQNSIQKSLAEACCLKTKSKVYCHFVKLQFVILHLIRKEKKDKDQGIHISFFVKVQIVKLTLPESESEDEEEEEEGEDKGTFISIL